MLTNILLTFIAIYLILADYLELKLYEEKDKETFKEIILTYNNLLNDIKEKENKLKDSLTKTNNKYNEMYLLASCTPATARYLERLGYEEKIDYYQKFKSYPPATVVAYKRPNGARYEYGQGYSYMEVTFNHNKFLPGTVIGTEDANKYPVEIVICYMPVAEGCNFKYVCLAVTQDFNYRIPKECLKVGTIWEYRFVSYNKQ